MLENLNEVLSSLDDALIADGFNDAILGVDVKDQRVIYSVSQILEILSKIMTPEEALEYFEFNIEGSYVGEQTPIWCYDY